MTMLDALRATKDTPMVTEDDVRTAIAVLKAYVDGSLQTNLCDELDEAIERAWAELLANQPLDDTWDGET